ncbi:MAG: hypothetical protein Q4G48_03950 [Bacteroidia bacterium]|nr:hypothetical protein [Bacteroidia bacterium]
MKAEMPIKNSNYTPQAAGNQNKKTTLELALKERKIFEERINNVN